MIDENLVFACYRALLGREPENAAVVADKIRRIGSPEALIREMIDSPEFRRTHSYFEANDAYFRNPPAAIDVDMTPGQQAALFSRLQEQWRRLGESEPFWSVCTHDAYRADRLDAAALARFYETGAENALAIDRCYERVRIARPQGTCLELGCGVGRVTKHLAARFQRVIGLDISPGNLRACQALAASESLDHIDCMLLRTLPELNDLPELDFFYSLIVLQHNPPPIQKYILEAILPKIRPGGGFLFQTQIFDENYRFDIESYLRSDVGEMDMHCLPMAEVSRLIDKAGLQILEVVEDGRSGRAGSYAFFGIARA